ncbi:hypothetical protein KL951_004733 [Ogataea haglerorum]|nr:hypothetical protein KL951_004733 [Ogataea haglerorum]
MEEEPRRTARKRSGVEGGQAGRVRRFTAGSSRRSRLRRGRAGGWSISWCRGVLGRRGGRGSDVAREVGRAGDGSCRVGGGRRGGGSRLRRRARERRRGGGACDLGDPGFSRSGRLRGRGDS